MDIKQINHENYARANKFDRRLKTQAQELLPSLKKNKTIRDAIQIVKEKGRRALSGESLGRVFHGNSNKYCGGGGNETILNKVLKRNQKRYSEQKEIKYYNK